VALVVESEILDLASGDRLASERFVREHYADLYGWFLWLTNCPHRAADLTQDTFVAFWESLRRTTPDTSAKTWLYSIGRNRFRKDCRDRRPHDTAGDAALDDEIAPMQTPLEVAEHREFAAALEAEVARLPEDFREVFTLRLWQEFDYEEIAATQGISRELARWRFFRARQIIRSRLKAFGFQEDDDDK